jgi:hypothetical protein
MDSGFPNPEKLTLHLELQPEGVYVLTCDEVPELVLEFDPNDSVISDVLAANQLLKSFRQENPRLNAAVGLHP